MKLLFLILRPLLFPAATICTILFFFRLFFFIVCFPRHVQTPEQLKDKKNTQLAKGGVTFCSIVSSNYFEQTRVYTYQFKVDEQVYMGSSQFICAPNDATLTDINVTYLKSNPTINRLEPDFHIAQSILKMLCFLLPIGLYWIACSFI